MLTKILKPIMAEIPTGGGAAGGAGGGNTGGAAGDGGQGQGGAATGGQGTNNPWFQDFKSQDVRGYLETKGFKDPESLADAYRNLEKTRGVPAERLLTLPGDDNPESWNPIYDKLGRPKDPAGYEIKGAEGIPTDFIDWQQKTFHELGLNKKQAQSLSGKWTELMVTSNRNEAAAAQEAQRTQIQNLKTEWGAAAEQNATIVDKMIEAIGLSAEQVTSLDKALGVDGTSKFILGLQAKFGIKLDESSFHSGTGGGNQFGGKLTPAGAKSKREELLSDQSYRAAWEQGDQAKVKEINALYEQEYAAR